MTLIDKAEALALLQRAVDCYGQKMRAATDKKEKRDWQSMLFAAVDIQQAIAAIAPTDAAQAREAAMQELIDAYADIIDYGPLVLAKKDQWERVEAAKGKLKEART